MTEYPGNFNSDGFADKSSVRNQYRRKRRRKKNTFINFIIGLALFASVIYISLLLFFKVENFDVRGASDYRTEEIISASGINPGDKLIAVNTKEVKERIERNLPYIETAEVRMKLPSTIEIKITKALPAAYIEVENLSYVIINGKGKVLGWFSGVFDLNIPIVLNSDAVSYEPGHTAVFPERTNENLLLLLEILKVYELPIRQIEMLTGNIKLNYQEKLILELGRFEDVESKIKFAKMVITEKLSPTDRGRVDLAVKNHFYFKPDTKSDFNVRKSTDEIYTDIPSAGDDKDE